tara:strand:- start:2762 stop:3076 length:315 start_codon:yes stop_codon:yes gene_type:complete
MIAIPRSRRPDESIRSTKEVLSIVDQHDADGYLIGTAGSEIAVVTIAISPNARDYFIAWRSYKRDIWWTMRTSCTAVALPLHVSLIERLERDELLDVRKEVTAT